MPLRETPETSLPLHPLRTWREDAVYEPGDGPHQTLDLSAPLSRLPASTMGLSMGLLFKPPSL